MTSGATLRGKTDTPTDIIGLLRNEPSISSHLLKSDMTRLEESYYEIVCC